MAVERNGTTYGLKIKGQLTGSTTSKTKNVDYLNFDPNNSSANDEKVYALGMAIANSIMGGMSPVEILVTAESPVVEGGE